MKNFIGWIIITFYMTMTFLLAFGHENPDQLEVRISHVLHEFWSVKKGSWDLYRETFREIGDPLINPLMKKLAEKNAVPETGREEEWNQRRVAWALGEIKTEMAVLALISIVRDETLHVWARNEAARALGHTGSEHALDSLIQVLEDKEIDPIVTRGATYGLGFLKAVKAVPMLIESLDDNHTAVRMGIVYALGQIGTDEAVDGLIQSLDDTDGYVRRMSYSYLRTLKPDKNIEFLTLSLRDKDWGVREDAIEDLVKLEDATVDILIQIIEDKKNPARWQAVRILGKIQAEKASLEIVALLKDDDWMIRNEAAVALALINTKWIIAPLLGLLSGIDKKSCESAAWILGEIRSQDAVEPLLKLLEKDDYSVIAAMALAKIGSMEAEIPLIHKLVTVDVQNRRAVAWALSKLASEYSVRPLAQALKDADREVRFWAAEGLKKIGTPEALEALMEEKKSHGEKLSFEKSNR